MFGNIILMGCDHAWYYRIHVSLMAAVAVFISIHLIIFLPVDGCCRHEYLKDKVVKFKIYEDYLMHVIEVMPEGMHMNFVYLLQIEGFMDV
jgi:hypothetical protein